MEKKTGLREKTLIIAAHDEEGRLFDLKLSIPINQIVKEENKNISAVTSIEPKTTVIQEIPKEILVKPEEKKTKVETVTGQCPECKKQLGEPEKTWNMDNKKTGKRLTIGLYHCCGKVIRQVIKQEPIPIEAPKPEVKPEAKISKKRGRKSNIEKAAEEKAKA